MSVTDGTTGRFAPTGRRTWILTAILAVLVLAALGQYALRGIRHAAEDPLRGDLDDGDPDVMVTAMNTLRIITHQPWRVRRTTSPAERRRSIQAWKNWWNRSRSSWPAAPEFLDVPPVQPTRADPAPDFALGDID